MPNNNYRYIADATNEPRVNGHALLDRSQESPYELRSEEVQDIMTKMPSLIIRQGTTVLFAVMVMLFAGAYFIHFPDIVTTPVHIRPIDTGCSHAANTDKLKFIATATLPLEVVGKIKIGQQVFIKLPLYPFQQYGVLEGRIESISPNAKATAYLARIELMNGLTTSTNKNIKADASLPGIAEILTSDKTILQRLFESIH